MKHCLLTDRELDTILALVEQEADGLEEDFDSKGAKERVRYLRDLAAKLKRKVEGAE